MSATPSFKCAMKSHYRISLARASAMSAAVLVVGACAVPFLGGKPTPAAAGSNPLFVESTLPYHAPRFDLIRNEHYEPALEEGMRQHLAEIDAIAKQMAAPT